MDNFLKAYLERADEIIGNRTSAEIAHDDVVIEALNQGKPLKEALAIAGAKFPDEAIICDENNFNDLESHYDYIREHSKILRMLKGKTKRKPHRTRQ